MKNTFKFKGKLWLYPGKAGWVFVNVPTKVTQEIDYFHSHNKRGFGSLPVKVMVGSTQWKTSIFPDKKNKAYILPIKKAVREEEGISIGDNVSFEIRINS
jgi:hypothetical protein